MNLVLANPTYGPVFPECARSLRKAIMFASLFDNIRWVGDVSYDRENWVKTRDASKRDALAKGADGVLWVDSDMIIPQHALYQLATRGADFVSALYFGRHKPYRPIVWRENAQVITEWTNELEPVHGFGFGCCYTSAAVLRAVPSFGPIDDENGEDFMFCEKARAAGFQPMLDSTIICRHISGVNSIGAMEYLLENSLYKASPSLPPDRVY